MRTSGNCLIVERLVTSTLFKLLHLVFTTVQSLYWQLNGTARKLRDAEEPQNYRRSAHVLNVAFFHKFCQSQPQSLRDFICTHNRFEDPQYIIDNEHISLVTITDKHAIFGEAKEKGMRLWKSEFSPFVRVAQWEYCNKLIVVPLYAFHRMAEQIGDPKAQLIFLFNTARCGSTLLTQVMEYSGRCVAVSEPESPIMVATKYRQDGDSAELRQLTRDVLRWECRPYPSMQPPPLAYMLKITAPSATALPLFRELYPNSRCLFMYRDVIRVAKSMYRLSQLVPAVRLAYVLGKMSASCMEKIVDAGGFCGKDFRVRLKDDLSCGVLIYAMAAKAYLDMRKEGLDVSAVRYEDLIDRPVESCRRIMEFCGLPVSLAELAVKALEKDSQGNSLMAKSILGKYKEPQVSPESKTRIDELLTSFGLPPIGKDVALEGTITRELDV